MDNKETTNPSEYFDGDNGNKYVLNPYSHLAAHTVIPKPAISILKAEEYTQCCIHCNLTFENSAEYHHHNATMHGKKLITCALCSATFRRQDHLKRHIKSLHYNQRFCVCPVCEKDCKRQDILLKHIKKKHTSQTDVFHCRECLYKCQSHTELEKHEFSHLLTERHVCTHCKATFKRRDHMLRHIKSQHMNMSVNCPICKQTYKRKDHVVRHVREKHRMGYLNGKLVTSSDMV